MQPYISLFVLFHSISLNCASRKLRNIFERFVFISSYRTSESDPLSLDRSVQFRVLALIETHTHPTEHGVKSGSKALLSTALHFRALLRYRGRILLVFVSNSVQSCDAKSKLNFQYSKTSSEKLHQDEKERYHI